jgi:hypothetical protein
MDTTSTTHILSSLMCADRSMDRGTRSNQQFTLFISPLLAGEKVGSQPKAYIVRIDRTNDLAIFGGKGKSRAACGLIFDRPRRTMHPAAVESVRGKT